MTSGNVPFSWPLPLNWGSPAGLILRKLLLAIPVDRATPIVLFGSAALQMTVAPSVMSAGVDIFPDIVVSSLRSHFPNPFNREELNALVKHIGYGQGESSLYIQVCSESTFEPGPRCWRRTFSESVGSSLLIVPHPYDILFSKLQRYEAKDLQAFQEVMELTGHPDEKTFLDELQACHRFFIKTESPTMEDHFPKPFSQGDIRKNVRELWKELYGRQLNIDREILQPALEQKQVERTDYKSGHKALLFKISKNKKF